MWGVQSATQKHICEEANSQTQFLDLISLYQYRNKKTNWQGVWFWFVSICRNNSQQAFGLGAALHTTKTTQCNIYFSFCAKQGEKKGETLKLNPVPPIPSQPYSAALLFCGLMLRVSGVPVLVDIGRPWKPPFFFQNATSELLSVSPQIIRLESCDIQTILL